MMRMGYAISINIYICMYARVGRFPNPIWKKIDPDLALCKIVFYPQNRFQAKTIFFNPFGSTVPLQKFSMGSFFQRGKISPLEKSFLSPIWNSMSQMGLEFPTQRPTPMYSVYWTDTESFLNTLTSAKTSYIF